MNTLSLEALKEAINGEFAAIRRITHLAPQGEKVFPPTYEGGQYADEPRLVKTKVKDQNGHEQEQVEVIETVLLDSVQSQANRLETALLRAYDNGRIRMPLLQVEFGSATNDDPILKEIGRITALEAPHRMCDAIFRDSLLDGRPFRDAGIGARLTAARAANATPVFELCPTALIFGFWDSAGPRGGLGAKVQRALVSEIVGYQGPQKVVGKRPSSRIDPLQIESKVEFFEKEGGGWTFDEAKAVRKNGNPVRLKASEINHGNITPSLKHEDKTTRKQEFNHGGVTLAYAVQHTVLSLAALRRLRFPLGGGSNQEASHLAAIDLAARTVLAALALTAICFLDEDGHDLRSRCLLDGKPGIFQFVGRGEISDFSLDAKGAAELLGNAANDAQSLGLPWNDQPVKLQPSPDLSRLVLESRKRSMSESIEG